MSCFRSMHACGAVGWHAPGPLAVAVKCAALLLACFNTLDRERSDRMHAPCPPNPRIVHCLEYISKPLLVPFPCPTPCSFEAPPEPPCTDLFFPTYSLALAPDPLLMAPPSADAAAPATPPASPKPDVFLSVGLDSGLTGFKRPKLNLVVLLDVSGSMDCSCELAGCCALLCLLGWGVLE